MDGSSRVVEGKRISGYAIVGGENLEIIESGPLSPSWSAQACELYAVLRALKFLEAKVGTIYMDSKYAFGVIHTFGKIWEERGLINSRGKELIHWELITQVLQALRGPKRIAIVPVKGHQKGPSRLIRGNNIADREAKKAALRKFQEQGIRRTRDDERVCVLSFTAQEKEKLDKMGINENEGIRKLPDNREVLPKSMAQRIVQQLHEQTHWGTQALVDQFTIKYMCIGIYDIAKQVVRGCITCQRVNRHKA